MNEKQDVKMKKCSKCGKEKPIIDFVKDKTRKDGTRDTCKNCVYFQRKPHNPQMEGELVCKNCNEKKSITDFYIDKHSANGRNTWCKFCRIKESREFRQKTNYHPTTNGNLVCTICKKEKSVSEFYNCKSVKNGKKSSCKECDDLFRMKSLKENPLTYFKSNLFLKTRDEYLGKKITRNQVYSLAEYVNFLYEKSDRCSLTGLPMIIERTEFHRSPYSPSIDRIDNKKGYTVDNIRLVRRWVNIALNEWGEDIMEEHCIAFLKNRGYRVTKDEELD